MKSNRFSVYRVLVPVMALGLVLVVLTRGSWDPGVDAVPMVDPGRDRDQAVVGAGAVVVDAVPGRDVSVPEGQGPARRVVVTANEPAGAGAVGSRGAVMEEAFAAAREALRLMGNPGGPAAAKPGPRSFGEDPDGRITMRVTEDGGIGLQPGGDGADWGLEFGASSSGVVGYETLTAHPGIFSLFGLRLFETPVVMGDFETISGTTLTDTDANFMTFLSVGTPYVVELEGGASDGRLLEVVSWAGTTLTVAESLPADSAVPYTVRSAVRLSGILDSAGMLSVTDFNPDNGDLILIPSGDAEFKQYYHSSYPGHVGFFNAATGLPEDPLMTNTEGFFFLRRGVTDFDLVISGYLKTSNTLLSVSDTFSYFSATYPVGEELGISNLEASLQWGTAETADLVWVPDVATGAFNQYFYSDGTAPLTVGWRQVGAGDAERETVIMSSGFAIHRRSPTPYEVLLTPPSYYSGL